MMTTYTPEQKAEALELYREHGPGEAARRTGIRRGTISMWANRTGVSATRKNEMQAAVETAQLEFDRDRARLRPKLLAKVHDLLRRMDEPHVEFVGQHGKQVEYPRTPAQSVKAYATSVGILIDKLRLESGESTERTERVESSEFDREVAELVGRVRDAA